MAQLNVVLDDNLYRSYVVACKMNQRSISSSIVLHMETVVRQAKKDKDHFEAKEKEYLKKKEKKL